jgi:HAMP domain-containing protein
MARAIRRKYIIKKNLQLGILLETALVMLLVAVLVGLTVYLCVFRPLIVELSGEKLSLVNRVVSLRLLVWFVPTVLAIAILSVFFSHRIAGPIFVFQRALRAIRKGEPADRVRLRKNDRLKDFAEDINRLIDYLSAERDAERGGGKAAD